MERKNYIDNLRWLSILLLFPFHAAMPFNDYGENWYIVSKPVAAISSFTWVTFAWFMPLLFVLAGISAGYAMEKRTPKQFVKERVRKLFVPLISGILLLIPIQTYFAERFHNGYTGGYFQQYVLYFTKKTDLTGYTGGFTPGQLWFILYLFVISLAALPILVWYRKSGHKIDAGKIRIPMLLPLFIVTCLMAGVLDFGGKSVGEDFTLFLLGFFFLSSDEVIARLEKSRLPLFAAAVLMNASLILICYKMPPFSHGIGAGIYQRFIAWESILAFLGMAKRHFNFRTKATAYLAKGSFPIYVFHQSILVATAYYAVNLCPIPAAQYFLIISISAAGTFAAYEGFRRIPILRFLFGMRQPEAMKTPCCPLPEKGETC